MPRVTRIHLGGLSPDDLIDLASTLGLGTLSQRGAGRLVAHTEGNSLYCRALLAEIGVARLSGEEGGLPAPRELSGVILTRVAALAVSTRGFLSAASVLGQHAALSMIAAVAQLPDGQDEMDEAVAAGLLSDGLVSELSFTHPLYRAAIYADLSPTNRRRLHARAAELATGHARLAHRVAASVGPDESLANELEASALASAAAGDADASAWAIEQAAYLSPAEEDRERRFLDSAVFHLDSADTAAAARALASCQVDSAAPSTRLPGCWGCSPARPAPKVACSLPGRRMMRTESLRSERVPQPRSPTGWSSLVGPSWHSCGPTEQSAPPRRVRRRGPWHEWHRHTPWRPPIGAWRGWLCSGFYPSPGTKLPCPSSTL